MTKGKLIDYITEETWESNDIKLLTKIAEGRMRASVRLNCECDLALEIWGRVEKIWEN